MNLGAVERTLHDKLSQLCGDIQRERCLQDDWTAKIAGSWAREATIMAKRAAVEAYLKLLDDECDAGVPQPVGVPVWLKNLLEEEQ